VDEVVRQFLDHLSYQRERSRNTILAYKRDLAQFVDILKQAGVTSGSETIPVECIKNYLEWLTTQHYKPSTIARKCVAVRGFIEFWQGDDILALNYIDNQIRDLGITRHSPRVLTKTQIIELLTAPMQLNHPLGLRDSAILSLMYETGLRATDIIQLLVEDVNLPGKSIRPRSQGGRAMSIVGAAEHIERYINDGRPHLARIPEERSLFLNQRGKGLTRQGVWFIVRRWADEAQLGQNISPNTIRHSLVQHLIEAGLSNKEILRRTGLKSPNSLRAFNISQRKVGDE
jgi:integrase/recombinase XerD